MKSERRILKINKTQEERLNELRVEREQDIQNNVPRKSRESLVDKPVYVCIEGVSFSGYIKAEYSKKGSESDLRFDVETPHGLLNVNRRQIKFRTLTDYTNVVVPEELVNMTTRELLRELQYTRKPVAYYSGDYGYKGYETDAIKAVLSTREHIPSKKETKIAKKYAK